MANTKPRVLVMGATGQVGKGVIPNLIANPKVQVIAAARSPEKAAVWGFLSCISTSINLRLSLQPWKA